MGTYRPKVFIPKLIEALPSGTIMRVDGVEYIAPKKERIMGMLTRLGQEGYSFVSMAVVKDQDGIRIHYALQLEVVNL